MKLRIIFIGLLLFAQGAFADDQLEAERQENLIRLMLDFNTNARDTDLVYELYSEDIVYVDPLTSVSGQSNIKDYFDEINKVTPQFDMIVHDTFKSGDNYMIHWNATLQFNVRDSFKTPPLNYDGSSLIRFKPGTAIAYYHRDFYDHSNVYEFVPLMGNVVKWFKKMMVSSLLPDKKQNS